MYKLHLWLGPGKDFFIKKYPDDDWGLVDTLQDASELSIDWIQKHLGDIYLFNSSIEQMEILQVREHSK